MFSLVTRLNPSSEARRPLTFAETTMACSLASDPGCSCTAEERCTEPPAASLGLVSDVSNIKRFCLTLQRRHPRSCHASPCSDHESLAGKACALPAGMMMNEHLQMIATLWTIQSTYVSDSHSFNHLVGRFWYLLVLPARAQCTQAPIAQPRRICI